MGGAILACVGFGDNGYDYFNKNNCILFSTDNTHDYLFNYIADDMSSLPELLEKYITERINPSTFELKNHANNIEDINSIKEILISAHPYYKYEYKKVIINAIGNYLNQLLIYSVYNQKKLISDYPLNQKWYYSIFHALMPCSLVSAGDYPNGLFPLNFHQKYKTWVNDMGYKVNEIEETLIPNTPSKMPIGFYEELQTQKNMKNLLYFLLDIEAQGMEDLSIPQRIWLYGNMFCNKKSLSEMRVIRKHLFRSPTFYSENTCVKETDVPYLNENAKINDIFYPFYTYRPLNIVDDGIPENMADSFNAAIEYAKSINNNKIYEVYEIHNLQELLSIEILTMVQSKTEIKKCENCNKYFVRNDKKKKYCDRISAAGETCYKSAKKKRFKHKLENDLAFKLYNTAYKRHYAQYSKNNMTKQEFLTWQYEANEKLDLTNANELDIAIFEKWLNKR